jgi:hypothetical protein
MPYRSIETRCIDTGNSAMHDIFAKRGPGLIMSNLTMRSINHA